MSVLSQVMITAADSAGVFDGLRKRMVSQQILTLQVLGLMAATESDITRETIVIAAALGLMFEKTRW